MSILSYINIHLNFRSHFAILIRVTGKIQFICVRMLVCYICIYTYMSLNGVTL